MVVVRRKRLGAALDISLASFLSSLRYPEALDSTYEERHRQHLVGEGGQRLEAELKVFLASISVSNLFVSQEYFTYEEQHQQDMAAAEGRHLRQLEEEELVRQRAEVAALPLCSSLRQRQEEEVVAGLLLLLAAAAAAAVHLKRRQGVFKRQS